MWVRRFLDEQVTRTMRLAVGSKPTANFRLKTSKEVLSQIFGSITPSGVSNILAARFERVALIFIILLFIAACVPTTPAPVGEPTLLPRLLATVHLSPTPEGGEAQAAFQPTLTVSPTIVIPTETPYIGVFVGEAELSDAAQPIISNNPLTPQPTLGVVISRTCPTPPDPDFGNGWQRNTVVIATLGCPIQIMFGFNGEAQVYEHGVIYRRDDNGEMWAIAPGGIEAGEYWYVTTAPSLQQTSIESPSGLLVPEGDFFALWMGIFGVRDSLGFATTQRQDIGIHLQRFDGGTLLKDLIAGQVFALFNNGSVYGPY
jgi:hypothetical protein